MFAKESMRTRESITPLRREHKNKQHKRNPRQEKQAKRAREPSEGLGFFKCLSVASCLSR
jgi:hypothetical protein